MSARFHRMVFAFVCVPLLFGSTAVAQQETDAAPRNSTRKQRVQPDALAARAGMAVHWANTFETAMDAARGDGRPVLWYVPTVPGTFTDRKQEIDRYMLAGPWSWPAIINLVNSRFHPVRTAPDQALAEQFGLKPYEFVEPGIVIVGADGKILRKYDRLTTLHPQWLFSIIADAVGDQSGWSAASGEAGREPLDELWRNVLSANWRLPAAAGWTPPPGLEVEAGLLQGMVQFRQGDHAGARVTWRKAAELDPNHPLAAKAAMESLGIGPFVRGFEVFGPLPEKAWRAGIDSAGSAAPAGTWDEDGIWVRSVQFLLGMQAADGAFRDSDYDFGGFDSMPNVHMAITAIAGMALLEARGRLLDPDVTARIDDAVRRITAFCRDDANVNPVDKDEILWAESYRLRFLVAAARRTADAGLRQDIQRIAGRLENLQMANGTWYHEYPNAFVTATALTSLADAASMGASLDQPRVESGLRRLAAQRYDDGTYPYSQRRDGGSDRAPPVAASAGRIPVCELARYRWNAIAAEELLRAAETGLEHHDSLAAALKYDNHTSTHAYGGFFFWYDMHARSEAIAAIEDVARQQELASRQRTLILGLPELDGCFVDSHELGRCYGTSMALLSLALLDQASAGQ